MGTDVDDATAERLVQALDLNGSFVVGICVSMGLHAGVFAKKGGSATKNQYFGDVMKYVSRLSSNTNRILFGENNGYQ